MFKDYIKINLRECDGGSWEQVEIDSGKICPVFDKKYMDKSELFQKLV